MNHELRRPRTPDGHRRGALLVEGAVVLGAFLLVLFAALDLALAVHGYNAASAVARRIAREAVVRGADAPPRRTAWGPETFAGDAGDGSPVAALARPFFLGNAGDVALRIEWPDGENEPRDRVRVTVRARHRPLVPFLFGTSAYELKAVSTMHILH